MEARARKTQRRYDSKYIVHDERRFVYFVIQKVACTSVKTALLPLFDLDAARFERSLPDGSRTVMVHKLFDRSRYQVDRDELLRRLDEGYRDHFKFAFVRNPWDRLVSCYSQKIATEPQIAGMKRPNLNPPGEDGRFYPGMPFAEFVEAVHATPDEKANPHFRSQHTVVCDPQGRVMADFVGRFENLREDFAVVTERIGASALELPHRLKSRVRESRPYVDFYDEKLRTLVYERYERDIETFAYTY
ncbi:MAG: sulfotransferase family protein [Rubrobacter sp.]